MNAPRIWDKNRKVMYQPEQVCEFHFIKGELHAIVLWNGITLINEEFIALQPTGLPDKDGTKIFQGDILWFEYPEYPLSKGYYTIKWDEKAVCFTCERSKPDWNEMTASIWNQGEIHGNTCENPKLEFKTTKKKIRRK